MAYLTRWEPFGMPSISQDWSRFWSLFPAMASRERELCVPAVDVVRRGEDMIVRAELPGLTAEDIDLEAEEGRLVITADRRREEAAEEEEYVVREMEWGHFERALSIPRETDVERISADFHDGILEVTLPRAAASEPKAHKVDVRSHE